MSKEITEVIKTFEDAIKATGRPETPDFSNVPEDLREYFSAQYQMVVLIEALNEGWKPNWNNNNEPKYFPWFYKESVSSGCVFGGSDCRYSSASAGRGSRLCFKTRELAQYTGKQFIDIWNKIILK